MQNVLCGNTDQESEAGTDECALVVALQRREPMAHEEFVKRFGGRMLASARRILHSEQDCHDAVQQAFLLAFRSIDQFAGNARLGTWLHRILVNSCLMTLRAKSRRNEVSLEELIPTFDQTGHHAQPVSHWHRLPEDRLQSDETRSLVRQCIDLLPDDYRTILILRDLEEMGTEEAAATLEISPGAVKTRLHRARQALRTLLEPHILK